GGRALGRGGRAAAGGGGARALGGDGGARGRGAGGVSPAVPDPAGPRAPATPVIHPELGDNLAFELSLTSGDPEAAFRQADVVLSETFTMGRHTGVTLEARAILADFDPAERQLTVYHSFQAPNMMQDVRPDCLNDWIYSTREGREGQ